MFSLSLGDSHLCHVQGQGVRDCQEASVSAVHDAVETLALGGALTRHAHRPGPALRSWLTRQVRPALQLLPLQLHDPLAGEAGGRGAAGQGRQRLVVQDPAQAAVALQLVVLQPEALEAGQVRDDLLGQTGQVVGVQGERDQLGQP